MAIQEGTQFGPYRILERIGSGGMGEVYRALDTRLEREVALKLVSDQYLATELGSGSPLSGPGTPHSRAHLSHERFLREARSAATLNHPNICAIHDVGEQDGRPYLVMELLRGETLKLYEANAGGAGLTPAEVLTFSQQAASALAAAHAKGIIHREPVCDRSGARAEANQDTGFWVGEEAGAGGVAGFADDGRGVGIGF
jgi:serine/threonine protein kinase